jgi:hypothetical protein
MRYAESANANHMISFGQKITLLCHMLAPQFTLKQHAYDVYYRDNEQSPTLYRIEFYEGLIANEEAGVWPMSRAAEAPFFIEAVQGQPVFTTEEQGLILTGAIPIDGWIETRGIGL